MSFEKFEPENPPPAEPEKPEETTEVLEAENEKKIREKAEEFGLKSEDLERIENWRDLSEGQRFLVLENLSQLTLGRIHEEAQEKYKKETADSKFLGKIWRGITKQYQIVKQEKSTAEEIKEGGMEVHGKVLEQLTRGVKESGLDATIKEGKLEIRYVDAAQFENLTSQERRKVEEFNRIAGEYGRLPYEWSLATAAKKQREQFETAAALFAEAKKDILGIKARRGGENEAVNYVLQLENKIKLEQFLNTHPEVEEELKKIESPELWTKALKNIATERGLIFAAGFATRSVTTAMLGVIGLPAAAAIVGGWLGRRRAYETLKEREMASRKGVVDVSKEAANFVDAEHLTTRIDLLIKQINNESDEVKKTTLVDKLKLRLDYTQDKINAGLVNFGAADKRLVNQYSLIERINAASIESFFGNVKFEKRIRLEEFLGFKEEKIRTARQKFVLKQIAKGAGYGAAFALAGYAARHFMGELVEVIKGTPAGIELETPETPETFEEPPPELEAPVGPEAAVGPVRPEIIDELPADKWDISAPEEAAAKVAKELKESFEKQLDLATIQKGEGIIHVLRRQLLDEPQTWGFKGDPNDAAAMAKWANAEAGHLAVANNYFDPKTGFEVRVKWLPDHKVSYLLEKTPEGEVRIGEYLDAKPSGGGIIDKTYEYSYAKPVPIEEVIKEQPLSPVSAGEIPPGIKIEYDRLADELKNYFAAIEKMIEADNYQGASVQADKMFDVLDKNPKLRMIVDESSLKTIRGRFIDHLDKELHKSGFLRVVGGPNSEILFQNAALLGRGYGLNAEQGNLFARFLTQGSKMSKKVFENLLTDGHLNNNRLMIPLEQFKHFLQAESLPAGKLWEPRLVKVSGETETVLARQIEGQFQWMNKEGNTAAISGEKLKQIIIDAHPKPPAIEVSVPTPEAPPTEVPPTEIAVPATEKYFDASTYITKANPEEKLNMLKEAVSGNREIVSADGKVKIFMQEGGLFYEHEESSYLLDAKSLSEFEKLVGLEISSEEIKPISGASENVPATSAKKDIQQVFR